MREVGRSKCLFLFKRLRLEIEDMNPLGISFKDVQVSDEIHNLVLIHDWRSFISIVIAITDAFLA
jgi:hypothetical protein